ncbi:MAG: hypothetical protein KGZ81_04465 [Flavobacteriales bacterium]|nr:hypothetical protein [Flavobacteriales bacterium]
MSNEKLTLEHLSAYLPYEIKIILGDGEVKTVIAIREWLGWCVTYKGEHGETNIGLKVVKPILRPLSDLDVNQFLQDGKMYSALDVLYPDVDFTNVDTRYFYMKKAFQSIPLNINYVDFRFLTSNHFDVFGLIDKGLAVSIHDVANYTGA